MITRSVCLVVVTLVLGSLGGDAAADTPDCHQQSAATTAEHALPCAVLVARAIWLGPQPMDESFQLVRDEPAVGDRWFGSDKVMHFGVSFVLTLSTQYVLVHQMDLPGDRAWPVAAGTSMAFGLFKELADSQREHRPHFSWRDMAANTAGVAVALAVILL